MSHFYGTMQGSRGQATRCGTKSSGIEVVAAAWGGAIRTTLFVNEQGQDCYLVEQVAWQGVGEYKKLAEGVIGEGA